MIGATSLSHSAIGMANHLKVLSRLFLLQTTLVTELLTLAPENQQRRAISYQSARSQEAQEVGFYSSFAFLCYLSSSVAGKLQRKPPPKLLPIQLSLYLNRNWMVTSGLQSSTIRHLKSTSIVGATNLFQGRRL